VSGVVDFDAETENDPQQHGEYAMQTFQYYKVGVLVNFCENYSYFQAKRGVLFPTPLLGPAKSLDNQILKKCRIPSSWNLAQTISNMPILLSIFSLKVKIKITISEQRGCISGTQLHICPAGDNRGHASHPGGLAGGGNKHDVNSDRPLPIVVVPIVVQAVLRIREPHDLCRSRSSMRVKILYGSGSGYTAGYCSVS